MFTKPYIHSCAELDTLLDILCESEYIGFDFETTDLHHKRMEVLCCSFISEKLEQPICVPFRFFPGYEELEYSRFELSGFMKNVFSRDALYVAHNIEFEAKIIKYFWDITMQNKFCTMVASWYVDENQPKGLKVLGPKLLGMDMKYFKEIDKSNLVDLSVYCNADAEACYRLSELFAPQLEEEGLDDLFYDLEMPYIDVLVDMTLTGICVDSPYLEKMAEFLSEKLATIEATIYKKFGHFNINSSPQLCERLYGINYRRKKVDGKMTVIFDRIPGKYPKVPFMTKPKKRKNVKGEWTQATPVPSTDDKALKQLDTPIAKALIEYRETSKLLNTYALGYLDWVIDGKIFPHFNHTGTVTGRLSSSDPNMQNIPAKPTDDWFMREVFFAPEGYKLIVTDESQIELRVLAHYCKDPKMIEAFMSGDDIHQKIASQFLEKPFEEIEPEERRFAKTLNFGIIYGMGPGKLGEALGISVKKATRLITKYYSTFEYINKMKKRLIKQMKKQGYINTICGRKRRIPELLSDDGDDVARAERQTVNSKIQGSAGDIIKVAMLRIFEDFNNEGLDAHIVLQIHDELVCVVKEEHAERAAEIIQQWMEHPLETELRVPLIAIPKICVKWSEGK